MSDNYSAEFIQAAGKAAYEKIRVFLRDDIGFVGDGNLYRHNIRDLENGINWIAADMISKQCLSRGEVIDYLLEYAQGAMTEGRPAEARETIMIVGQFSEALGIRKEMEETAKQRRKEATSKQL